MFDITYIENEPEPASLFTLFYWKVHIHQRILFGEILIIYFP